MANLPELMSIDLGIRNGRIHTVQAQITSNSFTKTVNYWSNVNRLAATATAGGSARALRTAVR